MSRILNSRLATMLVALVLAVGAAAAVVVYISRYTSDVNKQQGTVTVLVAAKDIPVGTSGEDVISKGFLRAVKVQLTALAPSAIQDQRTLDGRVSSQIVYAGAQLLNEQFPAKPNNLTSLTVKGDERAVQIPLDQTRGLVGTLKDGDRIDILASFSVQPLDEKNQSVGQPIQVTVTLLRDVQVLKAPVGTQSTTTGGAVAGGGNNQGANAEQFAMVAIKDRDVQRLVYSLENGKIWMSLRGDRATDSFQDKAQGGTPEPLIDSIASVIGAEKGFHLVPGDKGFNLVPSTGSKKSEKSSKTPATDPTATPAQ